MHRYDSLVVTARVGRTLWKRWVMVPLRKALSICKVYLVATDDTIVVFSRWRDPAHKDTSIARF